MFVILLKYVKSKDEIDKALKSHREYLDKYFSLNKFICSGRRTPPVGGLIMCNGKSKNEVEKIVEEDPFYIEKIAEYEIIEFTPTKCADGFEKFIGE